VNRKKQERILPIEKKKTTKQFWLDNFTQKAGEVHKRYLDRFAKKMLARCNSWKNSLVTRSKKYGVECNITVEELRQLMFDNYGKKCKFCHKTLDINTLVLDHKIPISKGGTSNADNLQIICSTSNSMKGSLDEHHFEMLLEWLNSVPEELKKDVSIRLSRGIN
jgi:5-methylcytosine-specific restriction endonuclease McrA